MRKLKLFGAAALLTLVASGVAVAHEGSSKSDTDAVTASFTATRAEVSERTCTGADGTYRIAREEFRGTVTSSDARLAGNLVLRTHSVINQTTDLGRTSGHAIVRSADGKLKAKAHLTAVNTSPDVLNGILAGHVRAAGDLPGGALVANFRAEFSSATTLSGELGGGAAQNSAVVQHRGGCPNGESSSEAKAEGKAKLVIKKGEVSALNATSLSVKVGDATVTFTLTERLANIVDELDLEVGSKVQVAYVVKGDTVTLLKLRKA